jgi:hypothetical protein
MRSNFNDLIYAFDNVIGQHTGSISLNPSQMNIEIDPIKRFAVTGFSQSLDVTWVGGVVNFNSGSPADSIYPNSSGTLGLWVLVESPPTVTPN